MATGLTCGTAHQFRLDNLLHLMACTEKLFSHLFLECYEPHPKFLTARARFRSLVPRPSRAPARKEFLVVLSQHAYGNFVMQRDSHMTAVAHLFRLSSARCTASKKEELLLIYSSGSAVCVERRLPAAYWASSRRYGLFYCVKLLFCRIVIAQSLNSLYNRFTNSNVVDVGDRRESGYNPNGRHPHPYYPARSLAA